MFVDIICYYVFQSTLPAGGATYEFQRCGIRYRISIHAPRGGSDNTYLAYEHLTNGFQSTLPAGGATR